MNIKNRDLIISVFIVILFVVFFTKFIVFKNTQKIEIINDVPQTLESKVEKFLFDDLSSNKQLAFRYLFYKACSFLSYGNDEKYIYGYASCQNISDGGGLGLDINTDIGDPIRLSYTGSDFKITGYEIPTSPCPDCIGTTPKDILPTFYYIIYNKNLENIYLLLEKENIRKMLSNYPITKDIAIFLAIQNDRNDLKSISRKLGAIPNGKVDAVGNEKDGWDIVLYMDVSVSSLEPIKPSALASCYHVFSYISVVQTGEYIPKKEEVVQNVNPKTCLIIK